MLMKLIR
jgi:hypothetical protein